MKKTINKLSTLLNGKSLRNFITCKSLEKNHENQSFVDLEQNSLNKITHEIDPKLIQKGLQNLDNPVLRGSFILVLSEQKMEFYDKIAKQAFSEVISNQIRTLNTQSPELNTIHLSTDPGGIQNKRPGIYIIKNMENGFCIVGQTTDLKKRFNQYTSRGKSIGGFGTDINKNFYVSVQKTLKKGLTYSQVFQRFVVYTWVDEEKQPLEIKNSLELKNEMNYLEHRLILAFFESNLSYNTNDAVPQLSQSLQREVFTEITESDSEAIVKNNENRTNKIIGPNQPKPFKVNNLCFESQSFYIKYRNSLDATERKKFLAIPSLRPKLQKNSDDLKLETRYLTSEEIEDARKTNEFIC